nr:lytic transglycosylase domain-containing protein [Phycocomes zhengii]
MAGCGAPQQDRAAMPLFPNETPELRAQIEATAERHDVPVALVQRVVVRESTHRPQARNGPYYGLMQILPQTARTMGYRGPPEGLLDAETNLEYGVKYLRGAYLVADGDHDRAVQWYARGYYYEARDRGMLEETGLR